MNLCCVSTGNLATISCSIPVTAASCDPILSIGCTSVTVNLFPKMFGNATNANVVNRVPITYPSPVMYPDDLPPMKPLAVFVDIPVLFCFVGIFLRLLLSLSSSLFFLPYPPPVY